MQLAAAEAVEDGFYFGMDAFGRESGGTALPAPEGVWMELGSADFGFVHSFPTRLIRNLPSDRRSKTSAKRFSECGLSNNHESRESAFPERARHGVSSVAALT